MTSPPPAAPVPANSPAPKAPQSDSPWKAAAGPNDGGGKGSSLPPAPTWASGIAEAPPWAPARQAHSVGATPASAPQWALNTHTGASAGQSHAVVWDFFTQSASAGSTGVPASAPPSGSALFGTTGTHPVASGAAFPAPWAPPGRGGGHSEPAAAIAPVYQRRQGPGSSGDDVPSLSEDESVQLALHQQPSVAPPPSRVLEFLFLGNAQDAQDTQFLSDNGITTIINVASQEYPLPEAMQGKVVVRHFPANDASDFPILAVFDSCFTEIDQCRRKYWSARTKPAEPDATLVPPSGNELLQGHTAGAGERVLLHCEKGVSRSPTVCIGYLVRKNGWTVVEAHEFLQRRRRTIEPNPGFFSALRTYEKGLTATAEQVAARQLRRVALTCVVRHVRADATEADVRNYFEETVGPVWLVKRRATEKVYCGAADDAPLAQLEAREVQSSSGMGRSAEPQQEAKPVAPMTPLSYWSVWFASRETALEALRTQKRLSRAGGPPHPLADPSSGKMVSFAKPKAGAGKSHASAHLSRTHSSRGQQEEPPLVEESPTRQRDPAAAGTTRRSSRGAGRGTLASSTSVLHGPQPYHARSESSATGTGSDEGDS